MPQHTSESPIGKIGTALPSAVSSASFINPVTITEVYQDGTSWYIRYSDGWIRQGGYVETSIASYGTTAAVTYITPFTHEPVMIHCTPVYTGTTGSDFAKYTIEPVDSNSDLTSGFVYRKATTGTNFTGFYWTAEGL